MNWREPSQGTLTDPKQYELSFESDLDRAAYTLAQHCQNQRHADYLRVATEQTGLSEQHLISHGKTVRAVRMNRGITEWTLSTNQSSGGCGGRST